MILLVGGLGSIGRRYQAVLRYLGAEFRIYDESDGTPKNLPLTGISHVIVASPTETHLDYIHYLWHTRLPFLIEKPVSRDREAFENFNGLTDWSVIENGYVVNNYAFLEKQFGYGPPASLSYDFYNTGRDGLIWDVCQLVYLAKLYQAPLSIRRKSPLWDCKWGETPVPYRLIERSYLQMVQSFLGEKQSLWNLQDGLQMSRLCDRLEQQIPYREGKRDYEGFDWDPSTERFQALTAKDLSIDRAEIGPGMGLSRGH